MGVEKLLLPVGAWRENRYTQQDTAFPTRASAFEETPEQGQRERGRRKGGDPVLHAFNPGLPSFPSTFYFP